MPELPEVETVVSTLKNVIVNDIILKVDVFWDNIIDKISVNDFKNKMTNQRIIDIKRYGKIIIFELDNFYMLSHLRMEGKYYVDNEFIKDRHSHVIFTLDNNRYLRYHDTRKFGKISLANKDALFQHPFLNKLAKEPFNISVEELYNKLINKRIAIKTALLDQHNMSGLGNIYVDEVLFRSKIHPLKKANLLNKNEVDTIISNSIIVLNKAIELGGTTIRSYTSSLGVSGKFQNELLVHQQVGKKCPICNTMITKIKVNGRGTYLCEKCQKLK